MKIGTNKKISTHKAINGCLGDDDRGRTHTAAILVGEVLQTFDPTVSEWGNPPACLVSIHKQCEFIHIIVYGWVRRELKHLSNARKINHMRFRQ